MNDKQPDALRLADQLAYAKSADDLGIVADEAAALLRAQHAEIALLHERHHFANEEFARLRASIERKDALLRHAVELIGSFSAIDICETQHHNKADQHSHIAQCPIAERFRAVWFAIKQELSQ